MENTDQKSFETSPNIPEVEEMAMYGITKTTVDYYCVGNHRYKNLQSAIIRSQRAVREG